MKESAATAIIVEGQSDCRFILQYIEHLGFGGLLFDGDIKSPNVAGKIIIRKAGGIGALTGNKISPDMILPASISNKVLIVVDANADIQKRRKQLCITAQKIKKETGTDTEIFLLPDNKTAGELENLLIDIFLGNKVAECFEQYKKCLEDKKLQPPNPKGEIYAYCEAHKAEPRGNERDYCDPKFWDLEHPALRPLQKFLLDNLSGD